jgi:sodium-dependent phosphate cotransporter
VNWPEWIVGIVLLVLSLLVLITCLLFMVKILNSVFQGPVAKLLQKIVNSDLPGPFRYLTGFVAIMVR